MDVKKDEPSTTGTLTIIVELENGEKVEGALVGLATSVENLDNSIYLREEDTDKYGKVRFGELNPGSYYFDCFYDIGDSEYYGEGEIQIIANQRKELKLTLLE